MIKGPTVKNGMSSSLVRCAPKARAMVDRRRMEARRRLTSSDFSSSINRWIGYKLESAMMATVENSGDRYRND